MRQSLPSPAIPSPPLPSHNLPSPPLEVGALEVGPLESSYGVWGTDVSSPSGVWSEAMGVGHIIKLPEHMHLTQAYNCFHARLHLSINPSDIDVIAKLNRRPTP